MRLAAAAREDLWAACEDEALTKLWTFQSLGGPSQAPLNIDHPQYKPYLNFQSRSEAAVPKRPFRIARPLRLAQLLFLVALESIPCCPPLPIWTLPSLLSPIRPGERSCSNSLAANGWRVSLGAPSPSHNPPFRITSAFSKRPT